MADINSFIQSFGLIFINDGQTLICWHVRYTETGHIYTDQFEFCGHVYFLTHEYLCLVEYLVYGHFGHFIAGGYQTIDHLIVKRNFANGIYIRIGRLHFIVYYDTAPYAHFKVTGFSEFVPRPLS